MFQHSFQAGTHFEVFDPKEVTNKVNKEKAQLYAQLFKPIIPLKVQRVFDQVLKNYIYELEGHSTKIQLPKSGDLGLSQQYLVLQIYLFPGYNWTLELDASDTSKTKRRIILTDSVNSLEQHFFHIKSPIDHIRRGVWLNLCINVWSFMEGFKGCTFRTLDMIVIGSPCKLRKIFIMKNPIQDSEIDAYSDLIQSADVPKQVNFPEHFPYSNQVISYRLLNFNEFQIGNPKLYTETMDKKYYFLLILSIRHNVEQQIVAGQKKLGKLKYVNNNSIDVQQFNLLYNQSSNQSNQEFKRYQEQNLDEKMESFSSNPNYQESYQDEESEYLQEQQQMNDEDDEEVMNLVYDENLKCFYDPKTEQLYQFNE